MGIAPKLTWSKRGDAVVWEYNAVRNKPNTESTSQEGEGAIVFLGSGRKKFNPVMVRVLLKIYHCIHHLRLNPIIKGRHRSDSDDFFRI
jgi:hypothetical protein